MVVWQIWYSQTPTSFFLSEQMTRPRIHLKEGRYLCVSFLLPWHWPMDKGNSKHISLNLSSMSESWPWEPVGLGGVTWGLLLVNKAAGKVWQAGEEFMTSGNSSPWYPRGGSWGIEIFLVHKHSCILMMQFSWYSCCNNNKMLFYQSRST